MYVPFVYVRTAHRNLSGICPSWPSHHLVGDLCQQFQFFAGIIQLPIYLRIATFHRNYVCKKRKDLFIVIGKPFDGCVNFQWLCADNSLYTLKITIYMSFFLKIKILEFYFTKKSFCRQWTIHYKA